MTIITKPLDQKGEKDEKVIHELWIENKPLSKQGCGSVFGLKPDPGLNISNEGRFLKFYDTNILDYIKSILFCFITFGNRRPL